LLFYFTNSDFNETNPLERMEAVGKEIVGMKQGQFARALEQYILFQTAVGPQSEAFYCRSQALFEGFRGSPKEANRSTLWGKVKGWVLAIIFALASVFTLLRGRVNKLTTVHYLIDIKNSDNVYDRRSEYVLRALLPEQTINFFHVHRPRNVFSSLGQRANAVYFESLWKVVSIFLSKKNVKQRAAPNGLVEEYKSAWRDQCVREAESERQVQFWQRMFRWLRVERLVCLDDSRHTGELRLACQREGIETIAYMHARFNEYHVGLAQPRFDRYLTWSGFFRDALYELNPEYKKSRVTVCGYPKVIPLNKTKRDTDPPLRVMWLGESNINSNELEPYVGTLAGMEHVAVTYRGKPGYEGDIPYQLPADTYWDIDETPDFFESLRVNGIEVVVGTHSTALMECWLVGVPALMIRCSYDYAWGLVESGIIEGCVDAREFPGQILELADMGEKQLKVSRKKLWGDQPEWNLARLRKYLDPKIQA
jgi:hypothetical protein